MTHTLTDPDCPQSVRDQINGGVTQEVGEAHADFEEAIRLLEVGEYLYEARAYSYGNGYDEPREYGIDWQWQQSKPNEYGQGVLLAEAVAWQEQMLEDGSETQATKLRRFLTTNRAEREQLEARVKELEEALKPFADEAVHWTESSNSENLVEPFGDYAGEISVSHLRAARAALQEQRP